MQCCESTFRGSGILGIRELPRLLGLGCEEEALLVRNLPMTLLRIVTTFASQAPCEQGKQGL